MTNAAHMNFSFRAFAEDEPGETWQQEFEDRWPAYQRWFLRFGDRERPTYLESSRALKRIFARPEALHATNSTCLRAYGGPRRRR